MLAESIDISDHRAKSLTLVLKVTGSIGVRTQVVSFLGSHQQLPLYASTLSKDVNCFQVFQSGRMQHSVAARSAGAEHRL